MKKYLLSLLFLAGCSGSINAVMRTIKVAITRSGMKPKLIMVDISPYDDSTVKGLKEIIAEKEGITVDQMTMMPIDSGTVLKDDEKLAGYGDVKIHITPKSVGRAVPSSEGPAPEAEEEEPGVPEGEEPESYFTTLTTSIQRHKVGVGITIAALTAAVAGVMKMRSYRAIKNRLINTYQLGRLTPLQNKVWMATALASYRIPWYLRYLVNNTMGTLSDFVGANPRAVAELYYGHEPSQKERDAFIDNFFSTVQE